jgi:hypothetical protein
MLDDLITAEHVAAGWRSLTPDETVVASAQIGEALTLLRFYLPGLDTSVSSGGLSADIVRLVVVRMVRRYLKNPEGDRQVTKSTSIDDYTESDTRIKDNSLSAGDIVPQDVELSWLGFVKPGSAFTITLGGGR